MPQSSRAARSSGKCTISLCGLAISGEAVAGEHDAVEACRPSAGLGSISRISRLLGTCPDGPKQNPARLPAEPPGPAENRVRAACLARSLPWLQAGRQISSIAKNIVALA